MPPPDGMNKLIKFEETNDQKAKVYSFENDKKKSAITAARLARRP